MSASALWVFAIACMLICCLYLSLCLLWLFHWMVNNQHHSLRKFYIYILVLCLTFALATAMSDASHTWLAYSLDMSMFDLSLKYITITHVPSRPTLSICSP